MALEKIGVEAVIEGLASFRNGIGAMNTDITGFGATNNSVLGSTTKLGNGLLGLAGIASGVVVAGFVAATTAAVAFATGGVKSAISMESAMSDIAAVMNKTVGEIQPLSDLILDLGLDPNLKVTADEAADAIGLLARNGLDMAQIVDGAARSTVLLANATGADFGNAANIATDAMSIFNFKASEMEGVVDGIVSVTTNSKFTIDDFALAIANGGAVAASSGVNFDDFNTVIAAISPQFSSGMTAGTAFKNLLLRLAPTTGNAKQEMRDLGIITEEGANRFFDANGQLKDMGDVAQILQDSLIGLSEEQRNVALSTIFGNDAMGAAIGLMNLGAESGEGAREAFESLQGTMGDTSAADASATRMDNLAGVLEILEGIIDTVQLQVGQAFIPVLQTLAEKLSGLVENIGPGIVNFFENMANGLTSFVNQISQGGTLLSAFSNALGAAGVEWDIVIRIQEFILSFKEMINQIVNFVTEHKDAFIGAMQGIGAVLAGSVIIAIISGIGAALIALFTPINLIIAGVALLGASWAGNWGDIQGKTQAAIDFIQPFVTDFITTIKTLFDENWPLIQSVVEIAWTVIQSIINAAIEVLKPAFSEFVESFKLGFSEFDTLIPVFQDLWTALQPIIVFVLQVIGAAILALVALAVGGFKGMAAAVEPLIETFKNVAAGIMTALTGVGNFITGFVELVKALFQGNSEAVTAAWEEMKTGLAEIVAGMGFAIVTGITGMVESVIELIGGLVLGVIEFFQNLYDELIGNSIVTDMVTDILNAITGLKDEFVEKIGEMVSDAIQAIKSKVSEWVTAGADLVNGLKDGVIGAAQSLLDAVSGVVNSAIDAAKNALGISSPSKVFSDIGVDTIGGLIRGVESQSSPFNNTLTNLFSGFEAIMTIGDELGESLTANIMAVSSTTEELTKNLFNAAGALSGIGSTIASVFKEREVKPLEDSLKGIRKEVSASEKSFAKLAKELGFENVDPQFIERAVRGGFGAFPPELANQAVALVDLMRERDEIAANLSEKEEKLLQIQKQRQDLQLLEAQRDLLDLVKQNNLSTSLLDGLQLGLDADLGQLLSVTASAMQQILAQAQEELGIASPSKEFMKLGQNIIAGLERGIFDSTTTSTLFKDGFLSSPMQQTAVPNSTRNVTIDNSRTTTLDFQNNFANEPTITDRDELAFVLATL